MIINNLLADVSTYDNAKEVIDDIYQLEILINNEVHYTISNLLGGPFNDENRVASHTNWIRSSLEETLMPLFGHCLSERPTLIELPLNPARFVDLDYINPYIYTLLGTVRNLSNIEKLCKALTGSTQKPILHFQHLDPFSIKYLEWYH